jgi:hypothetical protein
MPRYKSRAFPLRRYSLPHLGFGTERRQHSHKFNSDHEAFKIGSVKGAPTTRNTCNRLPAFRQKSEAKGALLIAGRGAKTSSTVTRAAS